MTDLTNINIEKSLELLKTKKISSKELVEFYLEQIKLNLGNILSKQIHIKYFREVLENK